MYIVDTYFLNNCHLLVNEKDKKIVALVALSYSRKFLRSSIFVDGQSCNIVPIHLCMNVLISQV